MSKKHPPFYTVRKAADKPFYEMIKMSDEMEPLATYQMVEGKGGSITCTCMAHKPWHRHCDILRKFQAEDRVNSGWFYAFDTDTWIPPLTQEA